MARKRTLLLAAVVLAVLGCLAATLRSDETRIELRAGSSTSTGRTTASTTTAPETTTTTSSTTTTAAPAPSTSAATSAPASAPPAPETTIGPLVTEAPPPPLVPVPTPGDGSAVQMIGDSVMGGATPYLAALPGWS